MTRASAFGIGSTAAIAILVLAAFYVARQPALMGPGAKPAMLTESAASAASPPAASQTAPAPAPAASTPSFDAVRVGPEGQAVVAGRAAPGAEVTVHDGGRVLGKVTADGNGEWVLLPQTPLAAGQHELSLSAKSAGAAPPATSDHTLAVLVPDHPAGAEGGAVAVLLPHQGGEAPRALQLPPGPKAARAPHEVTLDLLQYGEGGKLSLSGRADPHAQVQIYLNGHVAGTSTADAAGNWSGTIGEAVPRGRYQLRLEAHDPTGRMVGQLALPLQREAPSAGGSLAADYTVQPGNSLWRIAKRSYGAGNEYVEIYQANRSQITDPDLIYPGQILTVPAKR